CTRTSTPVSGRSCSTCTSRPTCPGCSTWPPWPTCWWRTSGRGCSTGSGPAGPPCPPSTRGMLSISGFGQHGDDTERAAYAPGLPAEAGLIGRQAAITGGPPADIAFAVADALAALHGTIAILAALRLRDRTGTGQHIDLSMLEAMLATDDYTHYSIDEYPVRSARGEVWPAPGGPILISADRRYLWRQLKA